MSTWDDRPVEDIEELLGAYALDAVDDDERAAMEAHLQTCPRCRADLADHLEVAALLANSGGPAPEQLWDRIAASLEEAPPALRLTVAPADRETGTASVLRPLAPEPPSVASPSQAGAAAENAPISLSSRRRSTRWLTGLVAVAAAVALVLGVAVVRQSNRIDQLSQDVASVDMARAAAEAMTQPTAKTVAMQAPTGAAPMQATAVLTADGGGYLVPKAWPVLADSQTYQLWGVMSGGQVVSLGVLGNDPSAMAFQAGTDVQALAVTEEAAGGVPTSVNNPVVAGRPV